MVLCHPSLLILYAMQAKHLEAWFSNPKLAISSRIYSHADSSPSATCSESCFENSRDSSSRDSWRS